MQQIANFVHQGQQPARVVEVLHQIVARWPYVGQYGHAFGDAVKVFQHQRDSAAACQCHQMNNRVGGTANGHVHRDGVFKRLQSQNIGRLQIVPHHLDNALTRGRGHARMRRISRWYRGRAGQHHT